MARIVPIVEGHGEVQAVPVLIRRIAADVAPAVFVHVVKPLRMPRQRILKPGQLEEALRIAAIESGSDAGLRGIDDDALPPDDPESIRDAKGWLTQRMAPGRSYREVRDQPALTARMDLQRARVSAPSFDKMWRAVEELLR
jgi:hypothetical protein